MRSQHIAAGEGESLSRQGRWRSEPVRAEECGTAEKCEAYSRLQGILLKERLLLSTLPEARIGYVPRTAKEHRRIQGSNTFRWLKVACSALAEVGSGP